LAIEKAAYTVLMKERDFEIREYEPMLVALSRETDVQGNTGFGKLFGYISGNNDENQKIEMTAPVLNGLAPENLTIAFVMPKEYSKGHLPKPKDPGVQLVEIPGRQVAAIRFSGNIQPAEIEEKKAELLKWLEEKKIIGKGVVELARYNPPFVPGFMKHNELLIELERGSTSA
jgi:effector-binding domain-containing protein